MGLFTQRPEHDEQWAGLPSEPLDPESAAQRLGETGAVFEAALIPDAATGVASISIALPPTGDAAPGE